MSNKIKKYQIVEEKNEIDDHLLDIIGNEFKFDHQKGLSEWIKNSADAYIRDGLPDDKQRVFINFTDSDKGMAVMECIDFVGMSVNDIIKAFKRWGDPEAAKRGIKKRTYGGHGNGGKFYMRQMFKQSYFFTYSSGKFNVFGFSPNKKYGFAKGCKNISLSPKKATEIAGIDTLPIPKEVRQRIIKGKTGFTVVRGIGPQGMPNKIPSYRITERLKNHPQTRKLAERMKLTVIHNNAVEFDRLLPDKLKPKQGFEEAFIYEVPKQLTYMERGDKYVVEMANKRFQEGKLVLKTSDEAMEKSGRLGDLNRIDILGEIGVIASYQMYELGAGMYPQTVFIYGECECPMLEDPKDDCVKNDRSKLIAENPKTKALLEWMEEKVNEVAEKIGEKERKEQQKLVQEYSQAYNEFLNKWSNKFLNKIRSELLIGPGQGPGVGFGEGGSSGGKSTSGKSGKSKGNGASKGDKDGGGDKPKKRPKNPRVLLSSYDKDPLNPNVPFNLDARQGVVYQRPIDAKEGIFWINTSSPLAKSIIKRFGERSQQWRAYLFQRYIDIFIKEEIRVLYSKDSERFNPDYIDSSIFGEYMTRIYGDASKDLRAFLLEDTYAAANINE